jgi:hypothetical protein
MIKKMKIELNEKEREFLGKLIEGMVDRDYDEGGFEGEELEMLSRVLEKVSGKRFEVEFWK